MITQSATRSEKYEKIDVPLKWEEGAENTNTASIEGEPGATTSLDPIMKIEENKLIVPPALNRKFVIEENDGNLKCNAPKTFNPTLVVQALIVIHAIEITQRNTLTVLILQGYIK